jgi:Zn finger protein HypA/HybF involved in hydrogenase expression
MYEKEYHILNCPDCKIEITLAANIHRGFSDHEDIYCPQCKKYITEIRADMGYEIVSIETIETE